METNNRSSAFQSGPSRILYIAGVIAAIPLVVAGIRGISLPEWLSHLCISALVVAVVHLVDRYFYFGEMKRELRVLGHETAADVSRETQVALEKLTNEVNQKSERLIDQTTSSLNVIVAKQSQSLSAMDKSGIKSIYSSRAAAANAIADALTSPEVRQIRILGISLNDFVRGDVGSALSPCWERLQAWLTGDDAAGLRADLHVRLLLIDPSCFGARLRSASETRRRFTVGRLEGDVVDVVSTS